MLKKMVFVMVLLVFNCFTANAQAPFGFEWGATLNEIVEIGVVPIESAIEYKGNYMIVPAKNAPTPGKIEYVYYLYFCTKTGLQRIKTVSIDIAEDPKGVFGLIQYHKAKQSLIENYGNVSTEHEMVKVKRLSEFYPCIMDAKCGLWMCIIIGDEVNVMLSLNARNLNTGYIETIYDSKDFSNHIKQGK
jgi:hypothetical protein